MKRSFILSNLQDIMPCSICKGKGHNKRTCKKPDVVKPDDILTFFSSCKRGQNDFTNKIRENIIKILNNLSKDYFENSEYGNYWSLVHREYTNSLKSILSGIEYTYTQMNILAGRNYNHDFDLMYHDKDHTVVATYKIEFKNGGKSISKLPQFLSLSTKCQLIDISYANFWYTNYLDKYIACDSGLTEKKPPLEEYLKKIGGTNYKSNPFFLQLKVREKVNKKQKHKVVNDSIKDYLIKYAKDINIEFFKEKLKNSQEGKVFLMWCNNTHNFYTDMFLESEKTDIVYSSINKHGNVIQLQSGNTMYSLLLRWKNYKGILNPAWQISMKRGV